MAPLPIADPYAVLGLPRYVSTNGEIRARRRALLRIVHPDAHPEFGGERRTAFDRRAASINAAADSLLRQRDEIDRALRSHEAGVAAAAPEAPVASPSSPAADGSRARTNTASHGAPHKAALDSHGVWGWLRYTQRGQWTAFLVFVAAFGSLGASVILGFAIAQFLAAGSAGQTTPGWQGVRLIWRLTNAGASLVIVVLRLGLTIIGAWIGSGFTAAFHATGQRLSTPHA
jgi:hypothetical protein